MSKLGLQPLFNMDAIADEFKQGNLKTANIKVWGNITARATHDEDGTLLGIAPVCDGTGYKMVYWNGMYTITFKTPFASPPKIRTSIIGERPIRCYLLAVTERFMSVILEEVDGSQTVGEFGFLAFEDNTSLAGAVVATLPQSVELKYIPNIPEVREVVSQLIADDKLGEFLRKKYPTAHDVQTDKALFDYAVKLKDEFLPGTPPLKKVRYGKKPYIQNTLAICHPEAREIIVASFFKHAPFEMLKAVVLHELAHLKESGHGDAFYQLYGSMVPNHQQLKLDRALFLTYVDLGGTLYPQAEAKH